MLATFDHQDICVTFMASCLLQNPCIRSAGALAPEIIRNALDTAEQLAAQASKSFFMPLSLTALAMLARIQVSQHHVEGASLSTRKTTCDLVKLYQCASLLQADT
jgi:hypothetical protein